MEPLERGVAIQFLNREPLEPPVSNMELLEPGVAFLIVSKYGRKRYLDMEPFERGVAVRFLNREPLEPPVSSTKLLERGVANTF